MALTSAEFDRQFKASTKSGNQRLSRQPVADAVRYDRRLRKIVIGLSNGCTLLVPPELAEGLSNASPDDLCHAKILGPGTSIDWPKLDVQLSVTGLLNGHFGTPEWMAQLDNRSGESVARRARTKQRRLKAKR